MADRNEKQVFISYSRFDYLDSNKQVIPGNAISKVMDAFNKAGITYWIDERGIYSGDEFVPLISKAIKACDVFLFISSAASNASDWTSNEIAAAYMYKKKIIPFRIDESTYNDSIIMFIAKLDYIDYNVNPDMAISRMVGSVLEYLKIKNFEKEKQEKEKENERKKKLQEQKKLISEIELSAAELDNDERDAELKRRRLINSVQNVGDEGERERLLNMIENSGSLYKKHKDEVQKLTGTIEQLTNERNCLKKDSYNTDNSHKNTGIARIFNGYNITISFLVLCILGLSFYFAISLHSKSEEVSYYQEQVDELQIQVDELQIRDSVLTDSILSLRNALSPITEIVQMSKESNNKIKK